MSNTKCHFGVRAVVLASVAVLGSAGLAEATVVWVPNANIPVNANFQGVFLNVVTGATASSAAGAPDWDVQVFLGPALRTPAGGGAVSSATEGGLLNLPIGTLINGSGPWDTDVATAQLSDVGQNRIYGFKFFNESATQTQFGWLRVRLPGTNTPGEIIGYAYDDSGLFMIAGANASVPTPGALALLSVGAMGFAGRRRRR